MDVVGEIAVRSRHCFLEWKIGLVERHDEGMHWFSPSFYFSDRSWYLKIFLGKGSEGGWWDLHLMKEESAIDCEVSVYFTLSLKEADGTLHKMNTTHCFTNSKYNYGWFRVVKNEHVLERSKFCPNKIITVHCEMRLKYQCWVDAESQTLQHNEGSIGSEDKADDNTENGSNDSENDQPNDNAILIQNFSDLYLKQQSCDVTIRVGDREFQAHTSILAARSVIFASMFGHDMKEKKSGVIEIDDCDPDAFHDFLLYLYTAKVDIISRKNVLSLYCIADKYLFQLTWWCEQFLLKNFSVEMFCDVLALAMKYNRSALIKAAEDFFLKYSDDILVTVEWQNFMKENYIAANELFIKYSRTLKKIISAK